MCEMCTDDSDDSVITDDKFVRPGLAGEGRHAAPQWQAEKPTESETSRNGAETPWQLDWLLNQPLDDQWLCRMRSTAGQSLRAVWNSSKSSVPGKRWPQLFAAFALYFWSGSSVALLQKGLRDLIDNIHDCIIEPGLQEIFQKNCQLSSWGGSLRTVPLLLPQWARNW